MLVYMNSRREENMVKVWVLNSKRKTPRQCPLVPDNRMFILLYSYLLEKEKKENYIYI